MDPSGERNIFREIDKKPLVGPVKMGPHRFEVLLHVVARDLLQDRFDKVFRITSYLTNALERAENPDEYISLPIDDALMYLQIVNAYCGSELGWDLEECIRVSDSYFKHTNVYPCLHSILASCFLKLGCHEKLAAAVIYGIKEIITQQLSGSLQKQDKSLGPFSQSMGFNSPNYIMLFLYACAKLVDLDVEEGVEPYVKMNGIEAEFNYIKRFVDNNVYKCCLGQTAEQLYKVKRVLTLKESSDISSYTEYFHNLQDDLEIKHAENHCTLQTICINDNDSSQNLEYKKSVAILFDPDKFTKEMMKSEQVRAMLSFYFEGTYKLKSFVNIAHRHHKSHIVYIIGKPYKKPHFQKIENKKYFYSRITRYLNAKNLKGFYKKQILPKLTSIVNDMRSMIIQRFYLEPLLAGSAICKLFPGVDIILARMMYLYYECAVPLSVASPNYIWFYSYRMLESLMSCMADLEKHARNYGQYYKNATVLAIYGYAMARMLGIFTEVKYRIKRYNYVIFNSILRSVTNRWKKMLAESFRYFKMPNIYSTTHKSAGRCICNTCVFAFYHGSLKFHGIDNGVKRAKRQKDDKECFIKQEKHPQELLENYVIGPLCVTRETQTNYSKFCCNNKQTMTDRRLSEEYALKKQLKSANALVAKKTSQVETKKALCDDQNKTINSLRKELLTAQRTVDEQAKELEILREKVAENSHVEISISSETQTDNDYISDIHNLRNINETITSENIKLRQQLFNTNCQYEALKVKCDNYNDCNKQLQVTLRAKADDYLDLQNKFKSFEMEQMMKSKLDQSVLVDVITGIFNSLKEFVDLVVDKMNQFKSNCYRIHQDLYSMFYSCITNLKVKQSFEANLAFLTNLVSQTECNLHILTNYKAKLCDSTMELNLVTLLNFVDWKTVLLRTEELCSNLFCQYIRNLNIMLVLHIGTLAEKSRESDKPYTQYTLLNDNSSLAYQAVIEGNTASATKPGPVGANRPQPSTSYHNLNTQTSEIDDPNAKSILSQIADTVKYPPALSSIFGALDPQFGAIRRSPVNSRVHQQEPVAVSENASWNQTCGPSANLENDASDFVSPTGKFRDVFIKMQQRFPTALMSDLVDALEYVRHTHNTNLHKIALNTISELVFNYITVQSKNRLKMVESCDNVKLETWDSDDNCVICFERLTTFPMFTLKCEHKFHSKCLLPWIRKTNACPICRRFTVLKEES